MRREQIDRLQISHTAIADKGQGVSAVARGPSAGLLDLGHLVFKKPFVN